MTLANARDWRIGNMNGNSLSTSSSLESLDSPPHELAPLFLDFIRSDEPADTITAFRAYRNAIQQKDINDARCPQSPPSPKQMYEILRDTSASCCHVSRRLFAALDEKQAEAQSQTSARAEWIDALVVGAGIAGLIAGIELAAAGARRVTVIEKRLSFTRRNVVHLWPHVCDYLK